MKSHGKQAKLSGISKKWKKSKNDVCINCRSSLRRINKAAVFVSGGVLVLAGIMVRLVCGSPWGSRAALHLRELLPSGFWMTFLWRMWYFILGGTFGAIMFSGDSCGVIRLRTVEKYRGGMYFLCMILLGFLWYPIFFIAAKFTLSTLVCIGVTILAFMTGISYFRISRVAGSILFAHAIFLLCLTVFQISILFRV
ncbi:MAG: tryptophan-rich sensory protein [Clostridia bacterium]|nr:tryptophan-rich sensory protein [Clostridia bacterium]